MMKFGKPILIGTILAISIPSNSTSVVVRKYQSSIFVAADTRGNEYELSKVHRKTFSDKACKLMPVGQFIFSDTGLAEDPQHNRSAFRDAQAAYRSAGGNMRDVASDWERRALSYFQNYYRENPKDILGVAKLNGEGALELGIFVGWEGAAPEMYGEMTMFDPNRPVPIYSISRTVNLGMVDLSTNHITEELIAGSSLRARMVRERWKAAEKKVPAEERPWKYLAFLIKETSKLDRDVSSVSDVAEIPMNGLPYLIHATACQKKD
jgi:hypothetical protein